MTGVLLAVPPADFVLHNSLFLVAHFHNVIIGGVVFGLFAGMYYWFPKAFGFRLDPFWGKVTFWGWVIGYWVAWTPIYIVGLMGTTRRVRHFDDPSLQIWFVIAGIGALIILVGILGLRHPDRGEHQEPQGAARHDGRSLGRPHARMVHAVAAAVLQLRVHARRPRPGRLVRHEIPRRQAPGGRLCAHPHAAQHRRGRDPLRHRAWCWASR